MMEAALAFILTAFVFTVAACVICSRCIKKPAVSESSTVMRSFVQSEINRRSMIANGMSNAGGRYHSNYHDMPNESYQPKDLELELC